MSRDESASLHEHIFGEWHARLYPSVIPKDRKVPQICSVAELEEFLLTWSLFPYFQLVSPRWSEDAPRYKDGTTQGGEHYLEAPLGRGAISLGFIPSRDHSDHIAPGAVTISPYYFRDFTGWEKLNRPKALIDCYRGIERLIKRNRVATVATKGQGPYAAEALVKSRVLRVGSEQFDRVATGDTLNASGQLAFDGWNGWSWRV